MFGDPDNDTRAAWAENAVNTFGVETYCGRTFTATLQEQPDEGDDAYTMCQDLLSNILHLATKSGWDAHDMLRKAVSNYDEEIEEEADEAESDDLAEACAGHSCQACGRPEADCSADPCPGVIADREA